MMDYETVRAKVLYVPSPEKAYNSKVPYEVGSKLLRSQKKNTRESVFTDGKGPSNS